MGPISFDGAFQPDECEDIISQVKDETFTDGVVVDLTVSHRRNSKVFFLADKERFKEIYKKVTSVLLHVSDKYGIKITGFQDIQIARYDVGDFYNWHVDMGESKESARKISAVIVLSDPDSYSGGHLEFDSYKFEEPTKQGRCIAFPSFLRHRVATVQQGVRYSLVAWAVGPRFV